MSVLTYFQYVVQRDHATYEGVRPIQIYVLRLFYFLMAVGVGIEAWTRLIMFPGEWDHVRAIAWCVWAAYPTLGVLGLIHPLRMLPIMIFMIFYKGLWLGFIAYPLWATGTLAGPALEMAKIFMWLPLLLPFIPWGYAFRTFVLPPRWVKRAAKAVAIAALVGAAAPERAIAQDVPTVLGGARVRIWLPEAHLQERGPWRRQLLRGSVVSTTTDTLRLSVPGTIGELAIPRASITRIDISRGRPSRAASAVERAISGAIVGAISQGIRNDPYGSEWPAYSRDWRAAEEGAKWGAAFGAIVGMAFPTERWRRVR
jgi:hypothetical protein